MTVRPAENASVLAIFGARWSVYTVTDEGGCSCALYSSRRPSEILAADRRRYEAKGWSQAKIARALEAKHGQSRLATLQELSSWLADLARVHGEVAIFAQSFEGPLNSATAELIERKEWTVGNLRAEGTYPLGAFIIVRGD